MKLLVLFMALSTSMLMAVSHNEAAKIGDLLYRNECNHKKKFLTFWNPNEEFPSLGIAHFIWFPKHYHGTFEQMFPKLLTYFKKKGVEVPSWLTETHHAPWENREQFMAEFDSPRMIELRNFLEKTQTVQASFVAENFEKNLKTIAAHAHNKKSVRAKIALLKATPGGLAVLIDYYNFKGCGTKKAERYKGQGWGLLQILEAMPDSSQNPVADFATTAKSILTTRTQNAPAERKESSFLLGWTRRINRYESLV